MSGRVSRMVQSADCRAAITDRRKARSAVRSFSEVVSVYRKYFQSTDDEGRGLPEDWSFDAVLKAISLCQDERGKRMPHQYRLKKRVLQEAHRRLRGTALRKCRTFDELFQVVHGAIGEIAGIGPLTVYDIANRLGLYLNLRPARVYLHAGTRTGAKALGLGVGRESVEISELPTEFHELSAAEIEDCLCIFKDELRRIARKASPV